MDKKPVKQALFPDKSNEQNKGPVECLGIESNVLDRESLVRARETVHNELGKINILINGAGGNHPKSTTNVDMKFFDIPDEASPKALIPPIVPILRICAVSIAFGSFAMYFCNIAAVFSSSIIPKSLFDAFPSVPIATSIPSSRYL